MQYFQPAMQYFNITLLPSRPFLTDSKQGTWYQWQKVAGGEEETLILILSLPIDWKKNSAKTPVLHEET